MSEILARLRPAKQRGIWREKYTSSEPTLKLRFILFVVDSGASMHMLSKKDLSSDDPTTVMTANGEVHTNEEAQVYVQDLDLFVSVQLLDETPPVLSLGKLCSEHGYPYEWKNGETPRLAKNENIITCTMDNFAPLVVPGLKSSSSSSWASTSRTNGQSSSSSESGISPDPVTTRSDKPDSEGSMQTDPEKPASGNRGARHS